MTCTCEWCHIIRSFIKRVWGVWSGIHNASCSRLSRRSLSPPLSHCLPLFLSTSVLISLFPYRLFIHTHKHISSPSFLMSVLSLAEVDSGKRKNKPTWFTLLSVFTLRPLRATSICLQRPSCWSWKMKIPVESGHQRYLYIVQQIACVLVWQQFSMRRKALQ